MRRLLPLAVQLALAAAAIGAPVKIGAVYANSGFLKPLDDASWRGTQAAAVAANRGGRSVELVYAPYDSSPASAAQAVKKVLREHPDVAGFVGISDTGVALAAGREAVKAGKVFVTSGATSPLLPRQVGSRFFLACFGDNVQAAAAAEWLRGARKISRAVVIYNSAQNYTRLLQRYFAAAFEQCGGKVVETMSYRGNEPIGLPRDMAGCEAVFLAAESAKEAGRIIAKLRGAGFKGPIVGGDGYDDPDYWTGEPFAENVYFTTHAYPALGASPSNLAAFRGSYRGTPDAFGGLGFDALRILLAANPGQDGDLARRLQNGASFSGVTGSIAYAKGSRVPTKPVAIVSAERPRQMLTQIAPSRVPAP